MIYKKSLFKRIFKLNDICYRDTCNHVFKEGEAYEVYPDYLLT